MPDATYNTGGVLDGLGLHASLPATDRDERYLAVCCNGEIQNITVSGHISDDFAERHANHPIEFIYQTKLVNGDWPALIAAREKQ